MSLSEDISARAERPGGEARGTGGPYWLVYDGHCPFCRASVRLLSAMDFLRQIRPMDLHSRATEVAGRAPHLTTEQMMNAMHLISPRGEVSAGFLAVRRAAWMLPLLWAVLPLLYLPGMSKLGSAVYSWIARHRYGLVRCSPGAACRL